jgi:uncharacterized protein YodC (DUF2158 family)
MRKRTTSLIGAASLVAASLAITLASPSANAAVGPGEDRQLSTPTSWWAYTNMTSAQVGQTLTDNHARLTDIKLSYVGTSPRFTVTEVANSGAYASGWYWYYGASPSSLVQTALNNSARITSLSCTVLSGATKCAAVMIKNTGANAEAWSAWVGSPSFINSKITSSTRMVSFSRVQGSSSYAAVFGSNTGTDHVTWWWYYGKSASSVVSTALTNHARVVDLDRNNDTGTYNAVMYANPSGTTWYTYVGMSASALVNKALQLGQRLFDLTPYPSGGRTLYAGVMVNNSNALTSKVIGAIAGKVPNGNWGFELKQVGGSVITGLQTTQAFEPASTIKVLYHYKSILAEQAGTTNNNSSITYHYNPADPTNPGICPDDYANTSTGTLLNADTQMMEVSDNRMTRGILEKYGKAAMLAEAAHLGMTHTQINHNIGCPTSDTHNYTSLSDLANLYSAFQQGSDITVAKWRTAFRNRMLNESNYPSAVNTICTIVKQEATSLGKSVATANSFCNNITWIAKGGSYQYGNADTDPISWANGSLTTLPVKSGSAITPKAYFYGDYFDEVSFASAAAKTNLANARTTAFQEALRPAIRAALTTW